jgi:hypothetical protein
MYCSGIASIRLRQKPIRLKSLAKGFFYAYICQLINTIEWIIKPLKTKIPVKLLQRVRRKLMGQLSRQYIKEVDKWQRVYL